MAGGRVWWGGMHSRGACMAGGVCMAVGHVWQGRVCMVEKTAISVGGTHPAGMHSCIEKFQNICILFNRSANKRKSFDALF